ncbi:hypothetical protein J7643_18305 [bacterium]|nr:hypothetical protein [bacterium]
MSSTTGPVPVSLSKKLARTLFPGRDDDFRPMPQSLRGRLLWCLDLASHWSILFLALVNLGLVLFDYTYLDLRHHYLTYTPHLVERYDPVKGVSPHRLTQGYVEAATTTFEKLRAGEGDTAALLADMRQRSQQLYQEDPFSGAGLSGVFEQIKNRLRRHAKVDSGKEAFMVFWSPKNLTPARLDQEQAFFDQRLRPLLARNYYRALGENGRPFDAFWMIDLLFIPFFAFDFLVRGALELRRGKYPSWKAFCYARWYDLVYFVPLGQYVVPLGQSGWLHLVRGISVGHRMRRLGLINPITIPQRAAERGINLATDLVSVRLLSNYQESIRRFDLDETIRELSAEDRERFNRFVELHLQAAVTRILPQVIPDLQTMITYSAQQALNESPTYQQLRALPVVGGMAERYLPDLVAEIVNGIQRGMGAALEDPTQRDLSRQLGDKLVELILTELRTLETEQEIKRYLIASLEQQKNKLLT